MAIRAEQLALLQGVPLRAFDAPFVSTRFQGSKKKLTEWIWSLTHALPFESALDLFGGTGAVSHLFKSAGKRVVYNDVLKSNWQSARALIENSTVLLPQDDVEAVLGYDGPSATFISETFSNIYFTDEENAWLDKTVASIAQILTHPYKRDLAMFALYQACIVKRPYNLFHRANLYMRTATVERSFGNATTWNRPFEVFFRRYVDEANAAIFDNGRQNEAHNEDAAMLQPNDCELVYLDTPYVSDKRTGTDYFGFYQFLEGLADYDAWPARVEMASKHRAIPSPPTPWIRADEIRMAFQAVIRAHADKIMVISYRDDGIPTIPDLIQILTAVGKAVAVHRIPTKYVLSNRSTHEVLIVAT